MNHYILLTIISLIFISLVSYELSKKSKLKLLTNGTNQVSGWWTTYKDDIYSLGLVALAIVFINVLCAKIGFLWWNYVYHHEAFGWLNTSLFLTVFLTMVARKPVVKYFAGALAILITVGVWNIGHPTGNHEPIVAKYTIKSGEISKILAYDDIVNRDVVPVEIRFNKPDSMTEFGEWQKVEGGIQFPYPVTYVQYRALTDTFTVRVKSLRTRS
ncbi:MAG: hypothetical protein COV01_02755 [Candidatus Taylorbacteria bacterium CG10_big_fil_rev_8_21_14_0_10_41_48]|uniref:Uncharacterized protein n=1 Tax=Candidatus Taylorbacteria bacterium CG10_big_fil_rev_8_21_14_0_10_41_48 TaxID=1975024 RepID=A0A2M8LBL7_9BACT|nr:MAG: hypothetical protein COV01_02755 [Candidatus Taylorbacteria bacterium CG10_big_fil_rev_8_21_14_0_10_41_48]